MPDNGGKFPGARLEVHPDEEFRYFDALPSEIKAVLRECAFKFTAKQVYADYEGLVMRSIPEAAAAASVIQKLKFQSHANWTQLMYDEFGVMPS